MKTDYVNNGIVITRTLFSIHIQIDLGTCYLKSENQFNSYKLAVKIYVLDTKFQRRPENNSDHYVVKTLLRLRLSTKKNKLNPRPHGCGAPQN